MRLRSVLVWAALAAAACKPGSDPTPPDMVKAVEGRSQQVLYAPARFALSATYATGAGGFRIEDAAREALGAVIETTADRVNLSVASAEDLTSPVFAQTSLLQLVSRVKANITALLPGANPAEDAGDWSITPVETGLTHDVYGNLVAYGRYSFEFKPLYQLRSVDMYRYLAAVLLRQNWSAFPSDEKRFYPSGTSAIHFSLAVSLHQEEGYYTGGNDPHRVGISFGAVPQNKKIELVFADLDDLMTFKSLGHLRDTLVEDTRVFDVSAFGAAADFVIAIDRNGSLQQEVETVRALVSDLVNRFAFESGYDFHVAFVTQGSTDYVRLSDGTRFISPASGDPDKLVTAALDSVLASADGSTAVPPDLLRTAALAITSPAANGVNKGFHRAGAPVALFYIGDRDDHSPALDGTPLGSADAYFSEYKKGLRPYTHWFLLAPSTACQGSAIAAVEPASLLHDTVQRTGGSYYDLCAFSADKLAGDVIEWGDQESSLFRFDAPQPFPFTLRVSVGGKSIARDSGSGFTYDVIGDRLVFTPSAEPQPGEKVGARFYRFDVHRTF